MRKYLTLAAYALLAVALPLGLTSCNSDDDDGAPMPTDAVYTFDNVRDKLFVGTWYTEFDGKQWTRYNADGTVDNTEYLEEDEDYDTDFNIGTWEIESGRGENLAYYGKFTMVDNEEGETQVGKYRFLSKDKLQITMTEEGESYTVTYTRSEWPTWDNTGKAPSNKTQSAQFLEGQWEASEALHKYVFGVITSNAAMMDFFAIFSKYIDQPFRIEMTNSPNAFNALVHFGEVPETDLVAYTYVGKFSGKWAAINLGTLSQRGGLSLSDGYFILKNKFRPNGYNVQYTHLGSSGVYLKPGKTDFQHMEPEGWYYLKKSTETVEYETFVSIAEY